MSETKAQTTNISDMLSEHECVRELSAFMSSQRVAIVNPNGIPGQAEFTESVNFMIACSCNNLLQSDEHAQAIADKSKYILQCLMQLNTETTNKMRVLLVMYLGIYMENRFPGI